ncbi:unnamed protein product [Notodromas monacha]|uniref:Protein quiver n=1 Tax=Notodromas monacha TaxID=399045 RepID=A0A7R9GGW4_9CRUS|nr:unnamed protein product [Notodromas monacha]CAG0920850.1 unnamed protein product [Notodromas monacha]
MEIITVFLVACCFFVPGNGQGFFDQLEFKQCYACADCEWFDPDTTPRCTRPAQNPLVPHSIGYSFPDSLSTKSCIKVIDRDGRVYRGCHNRVARDCVIVENVTACYCEHSLCNSADTRAKMATLPWVAVLAVGLLMAAWVSDAGSGC